MWCLRGPLSLVVLSSPLLTGSFQAQRTSRRLHQQSRTTDLFFPICAVDTLTKDRPATKAPSSKISTAKRRGKRRPSEQRKDQWNAQFAKLQAYQQEHGDCNVPTVYPQDPSLSQWVRNQRFVSTFVSEALFRERREKLDAIGFRFLIPHRNDTWAVLFERYKTACQEKGTHSVEGGDTGGEVQDDPKLQEWVNDQRTLFFTGGMRQERIDALESIDFAWIDQEEWGKQFRRLQEFHVRHGHCTPKPNSSLQRWTSGQRTLYHAGKLSTDQVKQLASLGFDWDMKRTGVEERWENYFQRLLVYQNEHGHCTPMLQDDYQLYRWARHQRSLQKSGALSEERYEKLCSLDSFIWDKQKKLAVQRDANFQKLVTYQKKHGHCFPDRITHAALNGWVGSQRRLYHAGRLSTEREEKLSSIGFEWQARARSENFIARWERYFQCLVVFENENGHCQPTKDDDLDLYRWVSYQQRRQQSGMLHKDRYEKLLSFDSFVWKKQATFEEKWENKFKRLVAYQKEHGHCAVPVRYPNDLPLWNWVAVQKRNRKMGTLSPERTARLESIGF